MALFEPEFGLVFWMLVVFLILLGILAKFAWPMILKSVEERADFIDKGVQYAQEAVEKKKQAEKDAQALYAEASASSVGDRTGSSAFEGEYCKRG